MEAVRLPHSLSFAKQWHNKKRYLVSQGFGDQNSVLIINIFWSFLPNISRPLLSSGDIFRVIMDILSIVNYAILNLFILVSLFTCLCHREVIVLFRIQQTANSFYHGFFYATISGRSIIQSKMTSEERPEICEFITQFK